MSDKIYGMRVPSTRKEFERSIYLLTEQTEAKLGSGDQSLIQNVMWAVYPNLIKVKKLANGRVNLATVRERTRLQANMANWHED